MTSPRPLRVASPARLCQSRHRRRRASAEPRASRRADRAPPTSSCVRRSRRRHTPTHSRVVCVVCRVTSPRLLRCIAGSALSEPTPARPPSERRAASESSCRPSAADLVVRAPIAPSTHAHALSCRVRRVSSDITAPLALHRRLGSVRADTGDARRASAEPRASRRADRAPPTSSCVRRSRRRHTHTHSRVACAVCRVTSPRLLRCIAGSALSEPTPATPAERAPSRERVVVPTERRRPCRACADRAVDTRTRTLVSCAPCVE